MIRTKIKRFAILFFIFSIVLLSTAFHYRIHIENALTLEPAVDYEIQVSVWRIIFEPLLGPLLFFNRSLYVLEEVPLTFLWILIFYLVFGVVRDLRKKRTAKKIALKQIVGLPLVAGICVAVFVVLLFIPLPNNTIVNTSNDKVLVTTHSHTEFSHDGLISQTAIWKWHKRNGFDAFFITDHANHDKSLEFSKAQRKGDFSIEPLVLVGQEYSGTNHMSLLGLNGSVTTQGMDDKSVIDSVHLHGGAVVINHWFDGKGKEKEVYNALGADGFEIENTGKDLYYDRSVFEELKKFCVDNALTMIGGLDFHGYGRACSLYNAFEIPNWHEMNPDAKEKAILSIIKKGPQEKIEVLLYKDRPYYAKSNLIFRPFLTVLNYFRTLNAAQVLSWCFWLLVLQNVVSRLKKRPNVKNRAFLFISLTSAIFMAFLGLHYYFRAKAVQGHSEVYAEYATILISIGILLLLYAAALFYVRCYKKKEQGAV